MAQFKSQDLYYATVLHEMGHWSGHSTRLDRDIVNLYGTPAYAREELRAEIASYMLSSDIGISHDPSNHASYIASWIEVLNQDKTEIFKASNDAERILHFIVGQGRSIDSSLEDDNREPRSSSYGKIDLLLKSGHKAKGRFASRVPATSGQVLGLAQDIPDSDYGPTIKAPCRLDPDQNAG